MEIQARNMRPDESDAAVKLAKKSFGIIERLFITKPESALVAVSDDKIVGGVFYTINVSGGKKRGIIDFIFTDSAYQGRGIGKLLCEECIRFLTEQRCDSLIAFIQGDNAASWKIFMQNGFVRSSIPKAIKLLGIGEALKLIMTTYGFAMGNDLYLAVPDNKNISRYERQTSSIGQVAFYMLMVILFALPVFLVADNMLAFALSIVFVFFGGIFAGYIGTLFSKRKWRFRLNNGGLLLCLLISALNIALGGLFVPMVGNWHPEKYENTTGFKKELALNSVFVWVFLILLRAGILISKDIVLLSYISSVAAILLVLKCIPFHPVHSYGAGRVIEWNKAVYGVLVIASVAVLYLIPWLIA